uniref:Putative serine protease 27 n=1 Tax=Reticulitermes speratus TaxID=60591 RepID=A0A1V1FYH4_9NEOP
MGTSLLYIAGAALMSLMVQQSAGQLSSLRVKQEAESKDRFNFFDLELLKVLASSQLGNLLLSPACVKASLAMLLEGAAGNSAKQVKEALRLPDDETVIRRHFSNFLNSLQVNKPPNVVEAANQIFLSNTIAAQPKYQNILKKYYDAEMERVDFSSPGYAAQAINRWVNMLTHGQIPSLVDPGSISRNTKMMLASAMYFKGKWKNAFDLDKTTQNCFYVEVNQCFNANFMETVNIYNYAYIGSLNAHAVELPYEGNQFSLLLLLPTKRNADQQLIRDLSHASLHHIVSSLEATDILISLPRFSIDYSTDLIQTLNELGVQEVFSTNANLTGMVQWINFDLHVSNFLHKAKIEINEDGTVAAAATGTLVVPLMGTSIPKLIFDHPFLFFLRNTETGDILFAGRMSQPEAAKQHILGPVNESQLLELTQGIFTSMPGVGRPVGSTLNPQSSSSNSYKPSSLDGSAFSTNKSIPVSQTQPPATNYHTFPNNQNTANNNPFSTSYESYPSSLQVRSMSNNLPQPNSAQYQSNSNSETYHASNPDTIGQNVQSPGQFLSTSGSYGAAINSRAHYLSADQEEPERDSVWKINQTYTDRIHFSP